MTDTDKIGVVQWTMASLARVAAERLLSGEEPDKVAAFLARHADRVTE